MATTTVDNHIVNMQLNNQDFERNASQSLSTIDKLKNSLAFKGASNGLNAMANTTRSLTTALASGVQNAGNKFKLLEVASLTVMSRISNAAIDLGKKLAGFLTAPLNQIKTGGWTRAANIDQAKFQLKGLGIEWQNVVEDLNYAVQDTAYGLDSAAKAASQFAASGVKLGDEMKAALRGVSGVAAMTNSEYDDIARIFATVSGNGRLMTMQLNQLGARGLNVAAELAKQLGKTEKEIREMTTQGKIDFQTFAKAMDDAFGQHAKDADKTFTGSLANVKAALSRIGADFAAPIRDNLIPVFNALKARINDFKSALGPVYDVFKYEVKRISKVLTGLLGGGDDYKNRISATVDILIERYSMLRAAILSIKDEIAIVFGNVKQTLSNVISAIAAVFGAAKSALGDVFSGFGIKSVASTFVGISEAIKNFSSRLILSGESLEKVKSIFRGFFAFLNIVKMAFMNLAQAISPVLPVIKKLGSFIFDTAAKLGEYVVQLNKTIEANNKFASWFSPVRKVFEMIRGGISGVVGLLKGAIPYIQKAFGMAKDAFLGWTSEISGSDIIGGFSLGMLVKVINTSVMNIVSMFTTLKKNIEGIVPTIRGLFAKTGGVLKEFQNSLKAGTLRQLSVSIALLAGSLFLLSLIDPARLLAASLAMKALFTQIAVMMGLLGKFQTDWSSITLAPVLFSIGISMLFMAGALKKIASLDLISLVASMIALKLIVNMMISTVERLNGIGNGGALMKGASQLILMGVALMLMASTLKKLSKIEPSALLVSLVGLYAVLRMLTKTVTELSELDKIKVGAGKLILLGVSLNIIALAVKQLAKLQPEQAVTGVIAIGAILSMLASYNERISKIHPAQSMPGLLAFTFLIMEMSASVRRLGQDREATMAGIAAIYLMIECLMYMTRQLASINPKDMKVVDKLSSSMTKLSFALTIMSVPISIFAGLGFKKSIIGIAALAGVITVLVIAAKALEKVKVAKGLLSVARAALIFSASMALVGAGVLAFSVGMATLAASGTAVVLLIKEVLNTVMVYLPKVARACVLALNELVKTVLEILPELLEKVSEAIILLLESLNENLPEFIRLGSEMLISIMEGLEEEFPRLVDKFFEMCIVLLDELTRALDVHGPELARAVMDFIGELVQTILSFIGEFFRAGESLFNSMGDGIGSAIGKFLGSAGELITTILAAFDDPSKWEEVGDRLIDALISAIEAGLTTLYGILEGFYNRFKRFGYNLWEELFGVESANKVFANPAQTMQLDAVIKQFGETGHEIKRNVEELKISLDDYVETFEGFGIRITETNDKIWADLDSSTYYPTETLGKVVWFLQSFGKEVETNFYDVSKTMHYAAEEVKTTAKDIETAINRIVVDPNSTFTAFSGLLDVFVRDYGLAIDKLSDKKFRLDFSEAHESLVANKQLILDTLHKFGYEVEDASVEIGKKPSEGISNGVDASAGVISRAGEKIASLFASGITENSEESETAAKGINEVVTEILSEGDTTGSIYQGGADKVAAHGEGMKSEMEANILMARSYQDIINEILSDLASKAAMAASIAGTMVALSSGVTIKGRSHPKDKQPGITRKESQEQVMSLKELAAAEAEREKLIVKTASALQEEAKAAEEAAKANEDVNNELKKGTGGSNKTKEDIEETTKSFEKFKEAVKGAVESGISIFEEFNKKTELSGKKLLENMRSQISGVTEWSVNLNKLAERGISQGLLQHLAEMGPQGYEHVHAFTTMTQEELAEANNLFAMSLKLPEAASAMIGQSWQTAGQMMNAGLTLGLQQNEETMAAMQTTSDSLLTTFKAAWGIASPSAVMQEQGYYIMWGLQIGLQTYYRNLIVPTMTFIGTHMTQRFFQIGVDVMRGFEHGIREAGEGAIAAAIEIAEAVAAALAGALDVESPSRVTMAIGRYVSEGLAIGIRQGGDASVLEAERLAFNTRSAIENVLEMLGEDEPVIRPVLDLSGVLEEARVLDSVFRDPTLSGRGRHYISNPSGTSNGTNGAAVVNNFTQNNYSPKALSRLEIYKQTRSQLRQASMMR